MESDILDRERTPLKSWWPFGRAMTDVMAPRLAHHQGERIPGKGSRKTKAMEAGAHLVCSCARQTYDVANTIKSLQHQIIKFTNVQNKNKLYHPTPERPKYVSIFWKCSTMRTWWILVLKQVYKKYSLKQRSPVLQSLKGLPFI